MSRSRKVLRTVAGGETGAVCCWDWENVTVRRFMAARTWDDGGGVSDEGITRAEGRSSLTSVLKDELGSIGDPGPSVDGRVTCESGSCTWSIGVVGAGAG